MRKRHSNKKGLLFVTFILVFVVTLLVLSFFEKSKKFENAYFSFTVPAGWKQDDLVTTKLQGYLDVRIRRQDPKAVFLVRALPTKGPVDFNDLQNKLRDSSTKSFKSFQEIKGEQQKISGHDGLYYEFKYSQAGSTEHEDMIITEVGDKVYYLIGQTADSDYNKVRGSFEKIFKSFKFKS